MEKYVDGIIRHYYKNDKVSLVKNFAWENVGLSNAFLNKVPQPDWVVGRGGR